MDEDEIDKEARKALIELIILTIILLAAFLTVGIYLLPPGDAL